MKKASLGIVFCACLTAALAAQTGKIIAPKAGDVWTVGNVETIAWNHTGSGTVRLLLMDASGAKVGNIKNGLSLAAGAFSWTVGMLTNGTTVPAAKGYKIQLKLEGAGVILDAGAGPFEIVTAVVVPPTPPPPTPPTPPTPPSPPTPDNLQRLQHVHVQPPNMTPMLRVTKPVDGTQVIPPTTCFVAWTLPGSGYDKVNIMLYSNGQPQWTIATNTENDGFFDWKLDGLERTGKYVVRVMTPDGKIHGDSGVVTIAAKTLPPEQQVHAVARTPEQMLAKSASLSVKRLDCFYQDCGLATVTVRVLVDAVPADGVKDFILSPDVGHPQLGSIYVRCRVEDPLFSSNGSFSVSPAYDRWISLKGGGGSEKVRFVYPQVVPGGQSVVEIVFDLKPPVPLRGQLVIQRMPRDLFGGGKNCRQYYFPKLIVTVHLITQGGDMAAARTQYMTYSEKECDLYSVVLPGEVTNCQEGMQDW